MSEEQQTNGIDPTVAKRWVGEIEAKFDELDSERGSYMSRCKGIREQIKDLKQLAQNAGVPRRGLNHLLKRRILSGKLQAHEDDAEDEVVETADRIDDALGGAKGLAGSPLGAAAGGTDGEEDLRGNRQREREAQRQADAEANLGGMSADSAKKDKAKRAGRKPKAGTVPLVGEDDGSDPLAKIGHGSSEATAH